MSAFFLAQEWLVKGKKVVLVGPHSCFQKMSMSMDETEVGLHVCCKVRFGKRGSSPLADDFTQKQVALIHLRVTGAIEGALEGIAEELDARFRHD